MHGTLRRAILLRLTLECADQLLDSIPQHLHRGTDVGAPQPLVERRPAIVCAEIGVRDERSLVSSILLAGHHFEGDCP